MSTDERRLYHQIHPAKLLTDFSTAFVSTYLLWEHTVIPAIVLALVPSIIVTLILMKYADLEKYRDSPFGHYIKQYLDSRKVDACRFGGFILMTLGGWFQRPWLIGFGFLVIIGCWSRGLMFQKTKNAV